MGTDEPLYVWKSGQYVRDDAPIGKILISLDYDGTASTNVPFWTAFVEMAKSQGYDVIIVTMRDRHEAKEIESELLAAVSIVVCTNRQAKKQFCNDLGIDPQIWIDDMPWAVYLNANGQTPVPKESLSFMHPDYGTDLLRLVSVKG